MLPSKLGMGNFPCLPSWAAGALSTAFDGRQAGRQGGDAAPLGPGPLGRLPAGICGWIANQSLQLDATRKQVATRFPTKPALQPCTRLTKEALSPCSLSLLWTGLGIFGPGSMLLSNILGSNRPSGRAF